MEQIISRDGTRIAFWRGGVGRPLLLVHGTSADHQRWAAILPQLEQHFSVYTMDRRGRGGSGDAPDYDIMREAEDVAAVVDAVAEAVGEPVFVLGHSYGAVCSLEASLMTDKISQLILYEPPIPTGLPAYPPGVPDQMQALVDGGELEAALELFFREVVRMPESELAVFRQLPMWKVRVALALTIPREMAIDNVYQFEPQKYANLTVPSLLLLGGDSPPLFSRGIEVVDATLPNSHIVILPGQQHVAMDTNPELFLSEVMRFLLS
jgi:pimeloyl-ACP methyl ester carboxylesterase